MQLVILMTTIIFIVSLKPGEGGKSVTPSPKEQKPAVNEGASTSRDDLSPIEICDLDNHASTIVNVFFAEDLDAGSLQNLNHDELEALDGFFEYIRNIFMYAVHGPSFYWSPVPNELSDNKKARINFIIRKIIEKILGILYESCSDHFRNQMSYTYNIPTRSLEFTNRLEISSSERCLCREGSNFDRCNQNFLKNNFVEIRLPDFRFHYETRQQLLHNHNSESVRGVQVQRYHIIPPAMIVKFLNTWLNSDDISTLDYHLNRPYHGCIQSIFHRFKNSLRKIMIHEIKRLYGLHDDYHYNFENIANDNFFYDVYERWTAQSRGGNIFFGPVERGPLNPSMGRFANEMYTAFERSVEHIIGEQRFLALSELNDELVDYVNNISIVSLTERLVQGVKLFIKMLTTFEQYESAPFNLNLWEERVLSDEERLSLNERLRRNYKLRKFWAPKNPKRRYPRESVSDEAVDNCFTVEKLSQRRWNEFIANSMQTLLINRGKNLTSLPKWECSFTELYSIFQSFDSYKNGFENLECEKVTSFDSFLYHHLSKMDAWRNCLNHNTTKKPGTWCKAWRRIMLNTNIGHGFGWKDTTNTLLQYQQDREVVLNWAANELIISDKPVKHFSDNPLVTKYEKRQFEISSNSICFSITISNDLGCPNSCQERSRRSIGTEKIFNESKTYEREWFRDRDSHLKCLCKKSMLDKKVKEGSVTSVLKWLGSVLFYTRCSNADMKNSERCTNLRR